MANKRKIINGVCTKCGSTDIVYRQVTMSSKLREVQYCRPCNNQSALESHKRSGYASVKRSGYAASKKYNKKTRYAASKRYNRKKMTGFTQEDYELRLIEQNYKCAICAVHVSELKRALAADHNHTTGKKRGLLCTRCNMMLGYAQDDPKILSQALAYLFEHSDSND